jgi:beta-phosphoglucomutase-like phosphatase (HAD superfamily)
MPPLAILFDLDGTLVQTREASWKIFARTNAAFNLGVDSQQKYFRLLEDNLFLGLRRLCRDEAHSQQVASHFLARSMRTMRLTSFPASSTSYALSPGSARSPSSPPTRRRRSGGC